MRSLLRQALASRQVGKLGLLSLLAAGCSVAYDATLAANEGAPGFAGAAGSAGTAASGGNPLGGGGTAGGSGGGGVAGTSAAGRGGLGGSAGAAGEAGTSGAAGNGAGSGGARQGRPCPGGTAAECDDGSPCTVDACEDGICSSAALAPTTPCDGDTNRCNGTGRCEGAVCVTDPTTAVDVSDADPCTIDACDPATGIVTHLPSVKPTDNDVCQKIVCDPKTGQVEAVSLADDANPCTVDTCELATGPRHEPKPTGDGNPCTVDACDPKTGAITHTLIPNGCDGCKKASDCDDGDPCTVDTCGSAGSCTSVPRLDGDVCKPGSACVAAATCQAGKCVLGTSPVIDDGDACTVDTCDPLLGVQHAPVPLDDGNACTQDSCDPKASPETAISHVLLDTRDGDPCTIDTCLPATGVAHVPVPGCVSCATVADCPQGKCISSLCVAGAEGGVCSTGNLQLATPCGDGQVCNGSEACDGNGACKPGMPPLIDDGNACTIDSCQEPQGVKHEPTAACRACAVPADCDLPSDVCFVRDCVGGKCTTKPAATGVSCSNGLKCDGVETCDGGVCKKGPVPDCGVVMCQGTSFVSPTCSQTSPVANGCGTIVQDCAVQNLVCSVGSNGCVGCDNSSNKCEPGKVCNTQGAAPHLCCTPQSPASACGSRVCGTVVDNCGQLINCGGCTTAPNLTCSSMGQCVCTPQATAITCGGRVCGTVTNNCGTPVSCGSCAVAPNLTCNAGGTCVCTPQTLAVTCGSRVCGTVTNNCGTSVNCGTCSGIGASCNAAGACVACTPEPLATSCGTRVCGTVTNNCGTSVSCGTCGGGKTCTPAGVCL